MSKPEALMGRVVYKLYYPFDMDDYDKEFP
jgi:hypothetical protein